MALSDLCDRLLTISRETITQTTGSAVKRTFAPVVTGVAFAVAPAADRLVETYARRNVRIDFTLYTADLLTTLIPAAGSTRAGVLLNDRITDPVTGDVYIVMAVLPYFNGRVSDQSVTVIHCSTLDS